MSVVPVYFWKRTPFLRLLVALVIGILVQWYVRIPLFTCWITLVGSLILINVFPVVSNFRRFQLAGLNGVVIMFLFISIGALLTWYHDIRHHKKWFANYYSGSQTVIVSLDEPLVEKSKSLKAIASVNFAINDHHFITVKGKIILYFKKDSSAPS